MWTYTYYVKAFDSCNCHRFDSVGTHVFAHSVEVAYTHASSIVREVICTKMAELAKGKPVTQLDDKFLVMLKPERFGSTAIAIYDGKRHNIIGYVNAVDDADKHNIVKVMDDTLTERLFVQATTADALITANILLSGEYLSSDIDNVNLRDALRGEIELSTSLTTVCLRKFFVRLT